jgi:hypothetical protein
MTRRKSLKGNRQAQRNYMVKAMRELRYTHKTEKVKKKYDRKQSKDISDWESEE